MILLVIYIVSLIGFIVVSILNFKINTCLENPTMEDFVKTLRKEEVLILVMPMLNTCAFIVDGGLLIWNKYLKNIKI